MNGSRDSRILQSNQLEAMSRPETMIADQNSSDTAPASRAVVGDQRILVPPPDCPEDRQVKA